MTDWQKKKKPLSIIYVFPSVNWEKHIQKFIFTDKEQKEMERNRTKKKGKNKK